ncbi:MAG: anti-sigma factor domain-containing protein [Pararhodobacter sp.]
MSGPTLPDDLPPHSADDLLAAEYVLGTLGDADRRAAAHRADLDGAFAALIRDWEARLAPLNAGFDAQPAPDLLPAIEARLFPDTAARAPERQRGRWFVGWLAGAMSGAVLAALALLAVLVWQPAPPPGLPGLQGELRAEADVLVFQARWDGQAGLLEVARTVGAPAAEGQDYELWVIDDSGEPRSLGLLRAPVTRIATPLAPGMTLAVSLEPAGGSPAATPTGPVLAAAALSES